MDSLNIEARITMLTHQDAGSNVTKVTPFPACLIVENVVLTPQMMRRSLHV